jgi:hypothetical protein
MKKRKNTDTDYAEPTTEKPRVAKSNNKKKKVVDAAEWLNERASRIWELHNQNLKPGQICDVLHREAGVKNRQICGNKQVSDWINYRKKTGHKTQAVSLNNNNLRADKSDSCMPVDSF